MEKPLKKRVLDIISKHDPIRLISGGAPIDEYTPEAEVISKGLVKAKSLDEINTLVHRTFVDLFDNYLAGKKESYKRLSGDLFNLVNER